MLRRVPRCTWIVVYAAAIFALSSCSGDALAHAFARWGVTPWQADLGHVPLFGGLAALVCWAISGPWWVRVALAGFGCALFAVSDEWHQAFVPGRVPAGRDLALDGLGIVLGVASVMVLSLRWPGVLTPAGSSQRIGDTVR